jgi:TolA-binding protein
MSANVLTSDVAIEASILIVRAFVALRQMITSPPTVEVKELQNELRQLKQYIEDVFAGYNDINEDTRMQLELINEALANLQSGSQRFNKPRQPVGFLTYKNES